MDPSSRPPRARALLFVVTLAAAACGDDGVAVTTSDTAATGTSEGGTTLASTSAASTTSTTDATTSTTSTTGATATTAASSTTTSTSGDESTSQGGTATTTTTTDASTVTSDTDGVTTGEEEGVYVARYFAGGLDRVMIRKAELQSDRCTSLTLVWPGDGLTNQNDPIDRPAGWGIEAASITQGAQACLQWDPPDPPAVEDSAGLGVITWMTSEPWMCPPTLDIEVTLEFISGDLPWVPMKEQLSATGLVVDGCL